MSGGQLITNKDSPRRAYNDINEADGAITIFGGRIEHVVYHRVTLTTGDTLPDDLGITRSTTLEPGSFTEIFRFVGPTSDETTAAGVNATINADSFEITDNDPPPGRAFYRFEAILAP